jgi:mRNA interferase MazF
MVKRYVPERGDLVWTNSDPQAGHEQAGRRPGVVLSGRAYNTSTKRFLVCPITSKVKGYPFEVLLPAGSAVEGVVLADHIKNLDWEVRQTKFAGKTPAGVLDEVLDLIEALARGQ